MSSPTRHKKLEGLYSPFEVRAHSAVAALERVSELHPEESDGIERMADARQAEYATARACARAALGELGIAAAVPRLEGGAPLWPRGFVGSISHTRGFCVAVAAHTGTEQMPAGIGVDVEQIGRMKPSTERRILTATESERLTPLEGHDRQIEVAKIFAAKEAFYKAHYQIEPRYLGFDAVVVEQGSTGVLRFLPGSGSVKPQLLLATVGRHDIAGGRMTVGVSIDTSGVT